MQLIRLIGLGLLSLPLVLGACSGSQSTVDLNRLAYPLDRYDLTESELDSTIQARYLLTQRCVAKFHLALPALESGRELPPRDDRYGLSDEHTARTWAYSLDRPASTATTWEMKIPPKSRLFALVNGVTASGRRVDMVGMPAGGCRAQANRTLARGSGLRGQSPVPSLERQAWNASEHSPQTQAAIKEWNQCLAGQGYHYADPVEAPVSYWTGVRMKANPFPTPEQRRRGVLPSASEKRAAVADVICKRESGLIEQWAAADVAAQRKLIATHLGQLRQYREGLDRIVRNAQRVNAIHWRE